MNRISRFFQCIWDDIGVPPKHLFYIFITVAVASIIIMIPFCGLAFILSLLSERSFQDCFKATPGIVIVLAMLFVSVKYVLKKWSESKKNQNES